MIKNVTLMKKIIINVKNYNILQGYLSTKKPAKNSEYLINNAPEFYIAPASRSFAQNKPWFGALSSAVRTKEPHFPR